MVARIQTLAFQGIEAVKVDVQVHLSPGKIIFNMVGLPDKAVAESRERVRSALSAIGLGLPSERITVNLAPADLPKEGSHYDLPIALGLMVAMGALPAEAIEDYVAMGELSLDGRIAAVPGVLPAAISALSWDCGLICPAACGSEAAWSGLARPENKGIIAADNLLQIINHIRGTQLLPSPEPQLTPEAAQLPDLADVRGQPNARKALEVAAAGGHNLLMTGPPGAGKSMLAARLASILPPLTAQERLEISMLESLSAGANGIKMATRRPFRSPHHSASMAALIGGGRQAKPGEISLAHNGVLFLDELPEFSRQTLDALRQPIETGRVEVARAAAHVTYPARFQLIAAMNPCRCGHANDPDLACHRIPYCMQEYLARLSGPLLDRFDIRIDVPPVSLSAMTAEQRGEASADILPRVLAARAIQAKRNTIAAPPPDKQSHNGELFANRSGTNEFGASDHPAPQKLDKKIDEKTDNETTHPHAYAYHDKPYILNAHLDGDQLMAFARPDKEGEKMLNKLVTQQTGLTARGFNRILRVARTVADLDGAEQPNAGHISTALMWRGLAPIGMGDKPAKTTTKR